ncbi:hypothetical protein [Photobacterium kishitanii]|nr:hypothetical protein [Photobacterium kishitanii]
MALPINSISFLVRLSLAIPSLITWSNDVYLALCAKERRSQ